MKLVFSDTKSGRSGHMELQNDKLPLLLNKKIGDTLEGALFGLSGYKLKITGGSDTSGFALEKSVEGTRKTKALKRISGSGRDKGVFERVSVRGNTISGDIAQINTVIMEYGDKSIDELMPKKEKAKEEKKEEKK